MKFKSIKEADLYNKKVLVRVDLNVPFENGTVTESSRIDRILPTINQILKNNGIPILISHFGRPNGKYNKSMSLEKLVPYLSKALNRKVVFSSEITGPKVLKLAENLGRNSVLLIENIRFDPGEEKNDKDFVNKLSKLGEVFCNDAFSVAHRNHASITGITSVLPSYAGLLMLEELNSLDRVLTTPIRPVTAVIGGSKISTKLGLLNNLIKKVDKIIIGGGMANTFLYAKGYNIGTSIYEKDLKYISQNILCNAIKNNCEIKKANLCSQSIAFQ